MFRRFNDLRAELGPANAVLWVINRICKRISGRHPIIRYYFVAQPVPEKPLLSPRRGRAIEIRRMEQGDPAFAGLPLTRDVLEFRFRQNAVCFGAFQEGAVVGCLWLCIGRYDEDEVRCRFILRPDGMAAWDFDVYVVPEARGGFAFLRLWDEANAYLRGLGVGWSLSRISAFNPGSLGAHGNLGARRIASALYVRIGALQFMVSAAKPYCHLSWSSHMVPELVLSVPASEAAG